MGYPYIYGYGYEDLMLGNKLRMLFERASASGCRKLWDPVKIYFEHNQFLIGTSSVQQDSVVFSTKLLTDDGVKFVAKIRSELERFMTSDCISMTEGDVALYEAFQVDFSALVAKPGVVSVSIPVTAYCRKNNPQHSAQQQGDEVPGGAAVVEEDDGLFDLYGNPAKS